MEAERPDRFVHLALALLLFAEQLSDALKAPRALVLSAIPLGNYSVWLAAAAAAPSAADAARRCCCCCCRAESLFQLLSVFAAPPRKHWGSDQSPSHEKRPKDPENSLPNPFSIRIDSLFPTRAPLATLLVF